jgi:hypothetical protein
MIFPGNQLEPGWTIIQARGMLSFTIADRFDLTLECLRCFYERETSPLVDTLDRFASFFQLFRRLRGIPRVLPSP